MPGYVAETADTRIARINDAVRLKRMHWLDQILPQLELAIERALVRLKSAKCPPGQAVITLTAKDGTQHYRTVWLVNPLKQTWMLDDHGQLYMYLRTGRIKVIPYGPAALRAWSLRKFDSSPPNLPKSALDAHDIDLQHLLRDINRLGMEPD